MFGMSPWHLAVLVLVGLFVFGPERLPTMLRDLGKALRQVRAQAQSLQDDLQSELGPEVGDLDLRSLHPRTFVEKHLFGEEEDPLGLNALTRDPESPEPASSDPPVSFDTPLSFDKPIDSAAGLNKVKYDLDAT
jgi:sec-independent protein translocase protein TatB